MWRIFQVPQWLRNTCLGHYKHLLILFSTFLSGALSADASGVRRVAPVPVLMSIFSFIFAFLGAHIVEYLVAVFTDLLHSQREPLALCLMFQLYDKDLKSLKVAKYPQLYQFNQYYKLWIPQQSQEPVVWNT